MMKRSLSILLAIGLLLQAGAVSAAQQTTNWRQAYKAKIIEYIQSDKWDQTSKISMFDIDRDGVPELFAGEDYRLTNNIDMAYTFRNGKLVALTHKGPGSGYGSVNGIKLGFPSFSLYKHKESGKYSIFAYDGMSGIAGWDSHEYLITLSGSVLKTTEISASSYSDETGDSYTFKGKAVNEKQYSSNRKQYFSPYTQVKKTTPSLEGLDFVYRNESYVERAVDQYLQIKTVNKNKLYSSADAFIKEYNKDKNLMDQVVIDKYQVKTVNGVKQLIGNTWSGTLTGVINNDNTLKSVTIREKMTYPTQREINDAAEAGMSPVHGARIGHILASLSLVYTLDPDGNEAYGATIINDWINALPNKKTSQTQSKEFTKNGMTYKMWVKDGYFNITATKA
ncbi:MAG: hypothetical protein P0Y55_00725 [Candidatus Cohnella colombiensis]|uniref:Uncharacterized protein n=1 Tax=Candidatus Cohnella colombiensis TaxID=3121368 RepID=A0AA95F0E2_9BACL|nr:MAG: hypothetical protein P0Y55_00725 [Cohnella sp.]